MRRRIRTVLCALAFALPGTAPAQQALPDLGALARAAEAGDTGAQLALAELYLEGRRVMQDYRAAAALLERAAAAGTAEARNRLGELYAKGRGVPQDAARARALLQAAAEDGAPEHIHDLAEALESGLGGAPDAAGAAELYARAAALGLARSAVSLGVLYQDGRGVPQDFARAIELWRGPAQAGDARAQNNLGMMYARGSGVAQDYEAAVDWFSRAADQGLAVAMRNLGVMYENGFGVSQDEAAAQRLYRLAGQDAAAAAGSFFFDPRLAPPDPGQVETYLVAAEAGDPVAMFLLGYLLAESAESAAELRRAADWFERAAARGSAPAMANLGLMAFQGRGRLQDFVDGYHWFTLASRSGLPGILALRDRLSEQMTSAQIEAAIGLAKAEAGSPAVQ